MLLQKITKAFRKQEWSSVVVEFFIVVVGIFVALQVDSWKTDRDNRAHEQSILKQLHSDFSQSATTAAEYADRHYKLVESLDTILGFLTKGELPANKVRQFRFGFVSMYQVPAMSVTMGGYDALIAAGDLALISDEDLKAKLVALNTKLEGIENLADYFRDLNQLNIEMTRDVVVLVPNEDKTDLELFVDFEAVKSDYRLITVVADQQRKHRIIGEGRRELAGEFCDAAVYIETLLRNFGDQPKTPCREISTE